MDRYVEELCREICSVNSGSRVDTIYLGGGTPSLLSPPQLEKIVEAISRDFKLGDETEFTIEANPETVTVEKLRQYRTLGVNRLSVGVQSFDDAVLKTLGRIHTAEKAIQAIDAAKSVFENVGIDLIYFPSPSKISSLPSLPLFQGVKHVSAYELTIEEGTPMYNDRDKYPDDDGEAYGLVKRGLEARGLRQYEISNYARPGFECRHNLAYWSNESYLGFGLSAHSYDHKRGIRFANTSDMGPYLAGNYPGFQEPAKDIDKLIMGLRKNVGMSESEIPPQFIPKIGEMVSQRYMQNKDGFVSYTEEGRLLSNRVLLEIMG